MPTLTFVTKYKKNNGLILSPSDMWANYLYGVKIEGGDGTVFSDSNLEFYIEAAQQEIERYLSIKFFPQLYNDQGSYYRDDYYNNFPMIKTNYPVNEALSLTGFYKRIEQIFYPKEWLSSPRNSDNLYQKRISIVPVSGVTLSLGGNIVLSGVTVANGSLRGYDMLPDYWNYQYVTGFDADELPMELVNLVGKFASIGPFNSAGDLILGSGISSQSLSIDSLSESISSTSSATASGYSSRIIQYTKEIKETLDRVKVIYRGITMRSL